MLLKELAKKYLNKKREKMFSKRAKSLKNKDVTILSNCCIGGGMYHDCKLKFLSPTINLFFSHHCFIDYVKHVEEYTKNGELIDSGKTDSDNANESPIGILKCQNLPDVEIHFLHYNSFEKAKEKWEERKTRINFKKIFLVIEAKAEHEHSLIEEYSCLPYPLVVFTDLKGDNEKVLHMKHYDRHKKPIVSFVGLRGKRGYDEFDFVDKIFNRDY